MSLRHPNGRFWSNEEIIAEVGKHVAEFNEASQQLHTALDEMNAATMAGIQDIQNALDEHAHAVAEIIDTARNELKALKGSDA